MYNFLAFSHTQILALHASTESDLLAIRDLLTESAIAVRTLTNYSKRSDHAGFTAGFAAFVGAYQRFVTSAWQFCCGVTARCSDYDTARYLHRVLIELEGAQAALKVVIHPPTFGLTVSAMLDYYRALARFHLGKANQAANDFRNAITNFRSTLGVLTNLRKTPLPPNFQAPVDELLQECGRAKTELERKIQSTGVMAAMNLPPLPAPANYPALQEPPPPTVRPPATSASAPVAGSVQGVAEWEAMMVLKKTLIERAERMMQSEDAKVQTKGKQFRQAIAGSSAADADVAKTVRAYQAGAPNVSQEALAAEITKTQLFYTDLEVRMNVFEATGR
jgi:hypothetical protein